MYLEESDMRIGFYVAALFFLFLSGAVNAQNDDSMDSFRARMRSEFGSFRENAYKEYNDFRQKANEEYVKFMREKWVELGAEPPIETPKVKPVPIPEFKENEPLPAPIEMDYDEVITPPAPQPQPTPIAPVPEVPDYRNTELAFQFYGTNCSVRVPAGNKAGLARLDEDAVADLWTEFCGEEYNNLLIDCINMRDDMRLSDWAYFTMLGDLSKSYLGDTNAAVVLWGFLFNQTGYAIRMGYYENRLYLLVALQDQFITSRLHYEVDGELFCVASVPAGMAPDMMHVMPYRFHGEKKMDMNIYTVQDLAWQPTQPRLMQSAFDPEVSVSLSVNKNLIDFYNEYPRTCTLPDPAGTSCWKFYADAPLNDKVKGELYPVLRRAIQGKGEIEAANIIIHFLQTTLEYRLDDEVWGGDRPFFAEETLFYPYNDCEDRAILFSRLIRDLLGLDVVLVYLPNHLATAVAFSEPLNGRYYLIDGRKYYYCEPTASPYADVGWMHEDYWNVNPSIIKLRN